MLLYYIRMNVNKMVVMWSASSHQKVNIWCTWPIAFIAFELRASMT